MTLGMLPDLLGDRYCSHNYHEENTAERRRTYIYSAEDTLTDWRDVEAHAKEAERKGFEVGLERYKGSKHVAHAREDERRYWGIFKRTVEG
jgi:hypothetical protein